MVATKICGLTRTADVRAAAAAGADAVGVVVDVPVDTPRAVAPDRANELVEAVPPFATSVLVTMPDHADDAVRLAERVGVDALQVHGLGPDECAAVAAAFAGPVLAAVATDEVPDYVGAADALLVDTPAADGGGGTGRTHDWAATRAATASLDVPVVLAGGLTPENVRDAVETVRPYAVDVASGVEREGGVKDHDAVRAFVSRARGGPAAERGRETP